MKTKSLMYLLIVTTVFVVTACAPKVAVPAAKQATSEPVTLRLAIADAEDRPSDPYVREFIEQVKTLSEGKIIIEPIWDAGAETTPAFEQGVIKALKEGQFDLGLAGSRAFDLEGITSFQALQAPFLIADDALAEAVAASDIARRMLENASSAGIVGLTLWPEDLRHPFSVIPGDQILSPEDLAGLNVRATPSKLTYQMLEAFGATPMMGNTDYQAAESGLRQGFSLSGTPTATGNVVFFPKFQVLFANGSAFEKLNQAQQTILREAALATQTKAITEHPSEVDAAAAWCTDGWTVVMASEEQVAAFEAAAQPVFASLEKDLLNAELIAAIRELKAKTEASPGASACTPQSGAANPGTTAEAQVWSEGFPPDGVWQVELTTDDIVRMGVLKSKAFTWAGVYTWTFQNGRAQTQYRGTAGTDYSCQGDVTLVEDVVRITYTSGLACQDEVDDLQWRLDAAGLHLHLVAIKNAPFVENKAYLEAKPWQKVEQWSTGLPPNGVWQVVLSADDFVQMGVMQSKADQMAGTYTWTLQDGEYILLWEGGAEQSGKCVGTYALVDDFVRLISTTQDCPGEVEDFRWRLDDEGLHIHLLATKNIPFLEMKANFEAKAWQKVSDP